MGIPRRSRPFVPHPSIGFFLVPLVADRRMRGSIQPTSILRRIIDRISMSSIKIIDIPMGKSIVAYRDEVIFNIEILPCRRRSFLLESRSTRYRGSIKITFPVGGGGGGGDRMPLGGRAERSFKMSDHRRRRYADGEDPIALATTSNPRPKAHENASGDRRFPSLPNSSAG